MKKMMIWRYFIEENEGARKGTPIGINRRHEGREEAG
jgi:hypothetical protein